MQNIWKMVCTFVSYSCTWVSLVGGVCGVGCWFSVASNGLLVRDCARFISSWVVLGTAGGGGVATWGLFSRDCVNELVSRERVFRDDDELSMPNWIIWARRNAFSFSSTVIWFWSTCKALPDFSANLAVADNCSFCVIRSRTYSTVFSSTVPLLYTYYGKTWIYCTSGYFNWLKSLT